MKAETAEALFERIRRRREGHAPATAQPVRVDEILAAGAPQGVPGDSRAGEEGADAAGTIARPSAGEVGGTTAAAAPAAGPFPRSATLRLLLKHPELALGIGLPAAGLILGIPKSRRLLGAAIRLATRPEVQQAVQLTSVLRQRGRRRSRSDPESG